MDAREIWSIRVKQNENVFFQLTFVVDGKAYLFFPSDNYAHFVTIKDKKKITNKKIIIKLLKYSKSFEKE